MKDHALMFNLETINSRYIDLPRDDGGDGTVCFCKLTECYRQLHYIRYRSGLPTKCLEDVDEQWSVVDIT